MPKRIKTIVDTVRTLLDQQGTYLPHAKAAQLVGLASMELFNHYLGRTDVTDGRPAPAYQVNTRVDRALNPFLRSFTYRGSLPDGDPLRLDAGVLTAPAEMVYPTALTPAGAKKSADVLEDAAFQDRLHCPITGPTVERPIVEILPDAQYCAYTGETEHPDALTLKCLCYPPEPVYAVTYESGEPVYDDAASVDIGWRRAQEPDLIARALKYAGISYNDGLKQQAAAILERENQ